MRERDMMNKVIVAAVFGATALAALACGGDTGEDTLNNTTPNAGPPVECRDELYQGGPKRGVLYDADNGGNIAGVCPESHWCEAANTPGNTRCKAVNPDGDEVCLDTPINNRLQGNIHQGGNNSSDIVRPCPEGFICAAPNDTSNLACMTTVQDEQSPWAKYPCFINRDRPKTAFDMDCRCQLNYVISSPLRMCVRPQRLVMDDGQDLRAGKYGAGPHVFEFGEFAELRGGFFDEATREIYIAGRFRAGDDPIRGAKRGFVMAISADTGDRRIVSGDYSDGDGVLRERGAGPGFFDAWKVERGPDGKLYVFDYLGTGNAQILRVDPATGDREFVWTNEKPEDKDPTLGVCDHGSTDPSERQRVSVPINGGNPTFAVDGQGRFYMAFEQAGFDTGIGVIRVGADGKSCEYVSRTGTRSANQYYMQPIGQGADFGQGSLSGFSIVGDTLYMLNGINGTAFSMNINTGDRTLLIGGTTALVYTALNPHNPNELWLVGKDTSTVIDQALLREKTIGDAYTFDTFNRGPLSAGVLGSGGVWFDPDDPDVMYFSHDNWSLVKAEISTFNNYILSL